MNDNTLLRFVTVWWAATLVLFLVTLVTHSDWFEGVAGINSILAFFKMLGLLARIEESGLNLQALRTVPRTGMIWGKAGDIL